MTILGLLAEKVEKNISILHTFSEDKKSFILLFPSCGDARRLTLLDGEPLVPSFNFSKVILHTFRVKRY